MTRAFIRMAFFRTFTGFWKTGCKSILTIQKVVLRSRQHAFAIRFSERFHPGMKDLRLLTFAAIASSIAPALCFSATFAFAASFQAPRAASIERDVAIILAQYEGTPSGQPGSAGGPAWHSGPGWRGEWRGGPAWSKAWPSTWGGGWYGGWYQPYWGRDSWASPYWQYGHPDYYGGGPGLCSGGDCWTQPPPASYAPFK